MYAVVDIAGKQFKVSPGQYIYAPHIQGEAGKAITLDRLLLIGRDDDTIQVGTPVLEKATISCTILEAKKGDKIIIFKKKRRKGYAVRRGHRQLYTQLRIDAISESEK